MIRRLLIGFGVLIGVLLVGLIALVLGAHEPKPKGQPGPEADAFARRMQSAAGQDGWEKTGYVKWFFGGRHRHQWDRERALVRVRWGHHDVLFDLQNERGVARQNGDMLLGADADSAISQARSHWNNDSYWLNPVAKLFDAGVRRSLVQWEGETGLLVEHDAGGDTPGDAYLWLLGPEGRPRSWRMWVQIIPVGGLSASWEGWTRVPTGAWLSTNHQIGPLELALTEVEASAHWSELEGSDPFLELAGPWNP
ncbi:MAG: hypothetical protein AAGD10_10200 [Myxococcota bacterium]